MKISQGSVDNLRRDIDRLTRPLRIVLISFTVPMDLHYTLMDPAAQQHTHKRAGYDATDTEARNCLFELCFRVPAPLLLWRPLLVSSGGWSESKMY